MNDLKKIVAIALLVLMVSAVFFVACGEDTPQGEGEENTPPAETEYAIQYTDDNGVHTILVKNGALYSITDIPQRTGYTFLGLYDAEVGGTQYVNAAGSALGPFNDNKNVVLFPHFAANQYTLALDFQGAEVIGEREVAVEYGARLPELPKNLTLKDKEFMGWYTQPNCKGEQIADKYGILPGKSIVDEVTFDLSDERGIIYLYAGFRGQMYDVTFYFGDGIEPETVQVEHGTSIADVVPETRVNGLGVYRWSITENDTELADAFTGKVTSDLVLYAAQFAPVIDFEVNGGEEIVSLVLPVGSPLALPNAKKENYKFNKWTYADGSNAVIDSMPRQSVTLYAKWDAMLVFDTRGGESVQNISAEVGSTIELPIPARDGFIFAGWFDGEGKEYTSTHMPSESVMLKARWYKTNTAELVLLGSNDVVNCTGSEPVIINSLTIDLSTYLPSYFDGDITFTVAWKGAHEYCSSNDPSTVSIGFYFNKPVSSRYFLGSSSVTCDSANTFISDSKTISANIKGNQIYVAICSSVKGNSLLGTRYYGSVSDISVEVVYPDTSTLY